MFDENFSFLSSAASGINTLASEGLCSSEVSPFSSRCPSPAPHHRNSFTTLPLRQHHDSRFFSSSRSALRHPSISTLTAKLESHDLSSPSDSSLSDSCSMTDSPISTVPSTPIDEGFSEPMPSPDYDLSEWDISMSDLISTTSAPTSSPLSSLPSSFDIPQYALRRRQRQALTRLQCLSSHAPDLLMLIEECHPSSMPVACEPNATHWAATNRSEGVCSSSSCSLSGRIEKVGSNRRAPRMRKRATR